MVALVDRGFNVQDLFLKEHVTVAMPPFTKGRKQFTKLQVEGQKQFQGQAFTLRMPLVALKSFSY